MDPEEKAEGTEAPLENAPVQEVIETPTPEVGTVESGATVAPVEATELAAPTE